MSPFPLINPSEFKAQIWGYPHINYLVELKKEGLYYRSNNHINRVTELIAHPNPEGWQKLINSLNEARFFNWSRTYEDPEPKFNGYFWSIKLKVGDRNVSSGGHNHFPQEVGVCAPFQMVCRAVSKLVERPFQ